MFRLRFKTILIGFTITLCLILTLGVAHQSLAFFDFNEQMEDKLQAKHILRPTEIFSVSAQFGVGELWPQNTVLQKFKSSEWRQRNIKEAILPGDFTFGSELECVEKWKIQNFPTEGSCIAWRENSAESLLKLLVIDREGFIIKAFAGNEAKGKLTLPPQLFAQYLGNEPIRQSIISLSDISPFCPQAIMAIEDNTFFEHEGFSLRSIGRALVKNISSGRTAQGGSTITQQLVKNYFLSPERTMERKIKELAMAVWIESKYSKDQIIETYMNIIYMGQSGAFQVRGYGAAANHYFGKSVQNLQLADCALLAAIINSPGLYNPFTKPESALKRRNLVLKKMLEQKMITPSEATEAKAQALPKRTPPLAVDTAPYFIDAAKKQLAKILGDERWAGLKIHTSMNLQSQQWAQTALQEHLNRLESKNSLIKKNSEKGLKLEAAIVSVDNRTGLVHTAIGGRSFRSTQFNRAVDSRRQVGSTMKPFVYLSALESGFSADSILEDKKTTYKVDKKSWTPENYDRKYRNQVRLEDSLVESLNAATVFLGNKVGLDSVILTAQQAGITSPLKPYPSISLGAFEVSAPELLNAYRTLANLGEYSSISFVDKVIDENGTVLFEFKPEREQRFDRQKVLELNRILSQVVERGTGAGVRALGFSKLTAGKTGTTSDYRDAWYVGFTPYNTTLVWIGYDKNEKTGLTGASGAIPIWTPFMIQLEAQKKEVPSWEL